MKTIFMNERGGTSTLILGFLAGGILFCFFLIIIDNALLTISERKLHSIVEEINMDIYEKINIEYTAFNVEIKVTDELKARQMFTTLLQKRLKLDSTNNPLDGSIAKGKVTILQFKVNPVTDGHGYSLRNNGIVSEIEVPFRSLFGLMGNYKILVTTEVYRNR